MRTQLKIWCRIFMIAGGIAAAYLLLPMVLGLGHYQDYALGPSFWYPGEYYKDAFMAGWRLRSVGGPTPMFSLYKSRPRYWGKDITEAFSLILFEPLPEEAEFTLQTRNLLFGGFGLYTKEAEAKIPDNAWVRVQVFDRDQLIYQETITDFALPESLSILTPDRKGISWLSYACYSRLTPDGTLDSSFDWHNFPEWQHLVWNKNFITTRQNTDDVWSLDSDHCYRIKVTRCPNAPEFFWVVRLRISGAWEVGEFITPHSASHFPKVSREAKDESSLKIRNP